MTLRPYQEAIYNEIPQRLKLGPVLVQAPARSGKSKIIAATAQRIISAGKIPLVLTHRDKIQKQLIDHCAGVSIDASTEHTFIQPGHCYVAMNQTIIKRPSIVSQLQAAGKQVVILTDEAHRGDFNKFFDQVPAAHRVGFTATPAWRWAKFLPDRYKSLIHGPQVTELINGGNVCPVDYYEMRNDLQDLKKSSTGDYSEESQELVFNRAKLYDGLFKLLPTANFTRCIIFCASKRAADNLEAQFNQFGSYRVTVFYSGLPQYNLAKFTELDLADILITVTALSEGFDHPPIDFNILWRATTSLPLFIQMGMRGATPHPGKLKTTVWDFGGNNSRFGGHKNVQALTMDRDWNALWQAPPEIPRLSNGVAAIKNCPACDFIISAVAKSCCNCGYIFPAQEVQLKEGQLVKIENGLAAGREEAVKLKGRKVADLTAKQLALYAVEKEKKVFAARIAKAKELLQPGFLAEYGLCMGYKHGWVTRQLDELHQLRLNKPDYLIDFHNITIG